MTTAIVIPAYNAELFIRDAISSVIDQSIHDWKLVVVDDGSKDETRAISEQFARLDERISVISKANGGLSSARNSGLNEVSQSCQNVLFLDADDALEPSALEDLSTLLKSAAPDVVGVYGLPRDMTVDGKLIDIPLEKAWGYSRSEVLGFRTRKLQIQDPSTFRTFVIWCTIQTAGLALIKMSAMEAVGPWRTMPGEDWEMWIRLSDLGHFIMLPRFTLRKRVTPGSLSTDGAWLAQAGPIIRNFLASERFTPQQRTIAKWGEFHACLLRASWALADFKQGATGSAARQFLRAGKAFAAFLMRHAQLLPSFNRRR